MAELISFTLNKAAAVVKNSLPLHLNKVKGMTKPEEQCYSSGLKMFSTCLSDAAMCLQVQWQIPRPHPNQRSGPLNNLPGCSVWPAGRCLA